jgi:hypothetical protein
MKTIELTQGKYAMVSDADYDYLNQWKWFAVYCDGWYAARKEGTHTIYMHRQIMSAPRRMQVDHKNGDGLDNRRVNLRVCVIAENQRNSRRRRDNRTGYKGVSPYRGKYRAQIQVNGKNIYLGCFPTPERAAIAYDLAAETHYGMFARLNGGGTHAN